MVVYVKPVPCLYTFVVWASFLLNESDCLINFLMTHVRNGDLIGVKLTLDENYQELARDPSKPMPRTKV